jgi:transcriptional regulator with XRE-family HTH domain
MGMELTKVNEKIGYIRKYLQLSAAEFAAYLGFTEELIRKVETPGQEIPVKVLLALLEKMNVSTDWLLTGQGNIFTQPGPLAAPVPDEASEAAGKNGFYLTEAEVDRRIDALEQTIKNETALSLTQIRTLFRKLLNLEIAEQPAPQGLIQDLKPLSFSEKTIYYQELRHQVKGAQQEFLQHFTRLVELTKTYKPEE